ncbi:MAG: ribonuclease P protein component [Planctomycetes bacterium]|nr:ribonuclease P protein component [Planctomycetota bacterium]MCB9868284.1 ribonuclease P protein component [Planctomycetota bacterium]
MPTATSTTAESEPHGYGLPGSARVRRNREFSRIYSRGTRASGPLLTVVALRRRDAGHRVGLSVAKIHGAAVRRNKIKRLLREAFRLERPTLPGQFDLVLIPKQRPGKFALAALRAELRSLVERVAHGGGRPRRPRRKSE